MKLTFSDFCPEGATGGHSNHLFYRSYITGPQGAHYELLREPHHTPDDVSAAKKFIYRNFDVVSLRIITEISQVGKYYADIYTH